MNKRSCAAVSLTILTPALLAGCSRECDPKKEPDCRPNGRGGYYRSYWSGGRSYSSGSGGSRPGTGVSGTSGRGGFGSFGGGFGRGGG